MEKVEFITLTDESTQTTSEHAIIRIEGGFITMPKEAYEAQQVEHLTEIVPADEPASKS